MKHIVTISFILVMLVSTASYAAGISDTFCHTVLSKVDREKEEEKRPPKRHRAPSLPIECTISAEEGIEIHSSAIDIADIYTFEICDPETDACLASFADESDFVSHLFTLSGEYQIRFETPDCLLVGYISL